jgi:MFS family permease
LQAGKAGLLERWAILQPLGNADFVRLWLASGIWWQAMWMEQLVLGWLTLEMTDSPWLVALLGFYRSIPLLFLGLFSSLITDRFKRRNLILVFQSVNTGCLVLIAILFWMENLEFWHLAAVSLVNGTSWALDWPTRRAILPDLVGKGKVVDAMWLENVLSSLTRISGPLGAGVFLETIGIGGTLNILGFMGVGAILILAGIKSQTRAPQHPQGLRAIGAQVLEGINYVRASKRILGVVLITIIMNVWAFPFLNLLPVFARDVLALGPVGLGNLGAANGIGACLGLIVVNFGRKRWSNEWLFGGGSLLACVGLVCFSSVQSFGLAMMFLIIAGMGQAGFSIMQSGIILTESADEMRSRAMGALVLGIGTGPFGRLQSGAMAESWGAALAIGSMAAWGGIATLVVVCLLKGFIRRDDGVAVGPVSKD